jgi:hypothetical protein
VFPQAENLIRTLPVLPHATKGDPEDADTNAEDHAPDALRYLLTNLGTGPEFPIMPTPTDPDEVQVAPAGVFAVRPSPDTPAWGGEDDNPDRGKVARSPWA